jgi:hypothetical protein
VELEKYLEKKKIQPVFEENAIQRVQFQTNVSLGGGGGESRFFFNFHIWTTEVILYNALNSEFANFETPCIPLSRLYLLRNEHENNLC